jgi:hypothetical protein
MTIQFTQRQFIPNTKTPMTEFLDNYWWLSFVGLGVVFFVVFFALYFFGSRGYFGNQNVSVFGGNHENEAIVGNDDGGYGGYGGYGTSDGGNSYSGTIGGDSGDFGGGGGGSGGDSGDFGGGGNEY